MEVVDIHGPRHLYWANENGMFPNMNYGKIMSRNRFEDIMKYLQLSHNKDSDQQITDFLMPSIQGLEMLYILVHTSLWMSL